MNGYVYKIYDFAALEKDVTLVNAKAFTNETKASSTIMSKSNIYYK